MTKKEVLKNLRQGKKVTHCGDNVTLDRNDHSGLENPLLWVNLSNGSCFEASYKDCLIMLCE